MAFQSLVQKLRPLSNFGLVFLPVVSSRSTGMRTSWVCVVISQSVRRMASVPWDSMMSSGSTPLPRDLDILRPSPSWIMAWMKTSLNGSCPSVRVLTPAAPSESARR